MALIYLDTSNIDLLSKIRQQDRERFVAFQKKWKELNCTLAISGWHIFELRRYADSSAREGRYQLLEELCPIRCQSSLIDTIEIVRALRKHSDELGLKDSTEEIVEAFSVHFNTAAEVAEMRQLEDGGLSLLFEAFYDASKIGAAASSREQGTKYERHRVSQLGDAKPASEQRATFVEEWDKQQLPSSELENFYKLFHPTALEELFNAFRDLGLRFLDRAEEVGSGNAFAEALGLDLSERSVSRSYTDQVAQQFAFRFSVREAAQSLGLQDEALLNRASKLVKLEDCPGVWLRNAVELQIKKAVAKDSPSNLLDLNHLSHLPHVDLLFTDKRIAEFTRQVLVSSSLPASLQDVKQPLAVPNSIEALESAIASKVL
jgi:DNA-binding Lrp family transcriptional regulator